MTETNLEKAISIFERSGGLLRMNEALKLGIHRRELYALRDNGRLEVIARGLYRLTSASEPSIPDLVIIAKKVPDAVICLISALAYHEITTQIPHFIYVALPHNAKIPAITHPPIRCFWHSLKSLSTGVEEHLIGNCKVKIFDIEKTLVDCIKYRNKIGTAVVIEALKMYWNSKSPNLNKLMSYAKQFRVLKVLKPIMETIVSG